MAGRPPKPTALKLLQGNPGKRPLPDREPKPKVGRPARPTWLTPGARRYWASSLKMLEEMGVLTIADGTAVALLCNALAEYVAAAKDVDTRGLMLEFPVCDEDGAVVACTVKINPAATVRADSWRRVNLLLQQFGMTPSSRAKVKVEKPEEADELGALLARGRR